MEAVLIRIVIAVIGLAVCFFGLRFWFILLPVFGGVTGFFVGARMMQDIFSTGFLATATSWIVGIIVAVVFALLSYLVWYAGATIQARAVGALVFSGVLHAVVTNPWGVLLFIVTAIGALIFAVSALILNLSVYIVIINSAIGGAALAIAGILTILGQITVTELANGAAVAETDESRFQGAGWLRGVADIVLTLAAIFFQVRSMNEMRRPEEKWVPARAVSTRLRGTRRSTEGSTGSSAFPPYEAGSSVLTIVPYSDS